MTFYAPCILSRFMSSVTQSTQAQRLAVVLVENVVTRIFSIKRMDGNIRAFSSSVRLFIDIG